MQIVDNGHLYKLKNNRNNEHEVSLKFYKDMEINGDGYEGTTNQEVLRALIVKQPTA